MAVSLQRVAVPGVAPPLGATFPAGSTAAVRPPHRHSGRNGRTGVQRRRRICRKTVRRIRSGRAVGRHAPARRRRYVTVEPGECRHRRWYLTGGRTGSGAAGRQGGIGVDQVLRARRLGQVGVERDRQVVEVQQAQRRAEVLRAELAGFGRCRVLYRTDGRTDHLQRVGEVGQRESAHRALGVRVIDVVRVADRVRRHVQDILQYELVVAEFLVTLESRWICSAVWLRLPAMNRFTSTTALERLVNAPSRSDRLPSMTLVTVARRSWNSTI